jgi:hypothetical protein
VGCCQPSATKAPPLRSLPLRRLPGTRQPHYPGGNQPPVVALAAFLTLTGPSSARNLPVLFHTGPVLGVLPSRVRPTRGAARPFERRCPLVVSPAPGICAYPLLIQTIQATALHAHGDMFDAALETRPHFKALLPASIRSHVRRIRPGT